MDSSRLVQHSTSLLAHSSSARGNSLGEDFSESLENCDEDDAVADTEQVAENLCQVVHDVAVSEIDSAVLLVARLVSGAAVAHIQVEQVLIVDDLSQRRAGEFEHKPTDDQQQKGPHQQNVLLVLFHFGS